MSEIRKAYPQLRVFSPGVKCFEIVHWTRSLLPSPPSFMRSA